MEWTTACPGWEDKLISGDSIIPPPLFEDEARSALDIFKALRVVDAPGCPTMGEACKPWVFDFVSSVFGAYDSVTGQRMMSEWLLSVSKKNFKSGLAAGVMMTALIRNWRESAEYGILAPTVEVAQNSFLPARDMVRKDEELSDLFQVQDHIRTITHRNTYASLKVIAAENETVGGKKFTGVLFDELWLFGKKANASDMMREATGGLTSRPEGFIISLTTMSNEAPAGVFAAKLNYARGVRDGRINDKKFVPVLYEFPKKMLDSKEYRNPKHWHITNPNMGASVSAERLDDLHKQANEAGELELIGFFSKHLNVEIGMALRADNWAGAPFWEAQGRDGISLRSILERCEVVDVGIDGGGLDDLLGLSVVGRDSETREWLTWCHAWAHPSVLERRKSEAARFRDFAKDGDLTLVEHIGDDVLEVASIVAQIEEAGLLDKVGVDPAGIGGVLDAIVDAGVSQDKIIGISQGWKLSGSIKTTERKLAEGALIHSGSPMMAWCVSNAKIEPKGNAMLITKQASGWAKIDPLMALFSAIALMSLNPQSLNAYTGELRMVEA
jgi:phage terminase large subunit-like protein